jgi:hypothetical protein
MILRCRTSSPHAGGAANGLRLGLRVSADDAAETYSTLANPDLYLLLTGEHGWTPQRYETWLTHTSPSSYCANAISQHLRADPPVDLAETADNRGPTGSRTLFAP